MHKRASRQAGSSDLRRREITLNWWAGLISLRRIIAAAILAPCLMLVLAGCSDASGDATDGPAPNPLLYEIASADGAVEGWLLGTIHALPDGVDWQTSEIARVMAQADMLVVEIASLDDGQTVASAFATLSTTPRLPPLAQRVPEHLTAPLASLMDRGGIGAQRFTAMETWAAAITLAQINAVGDPANGVDRALIRDFAGRPIRELEGAKAQLAIFDRLPEAQQRAMLAAVIRESDDAGRDPARLQRAWLAGDVNTIERSTHTGILADPTVRDALLVARNRRWAGALGAALEQPPRPLIAVGAAHLVGSEGLVSLLAAQGYRVRRLP